ncbi:MAG: aminotransferase class I/II-fold pyridoxal phosphate-dependent enzyme, partial [Gemmatimonas sp.]
APHPAIRVVRVVAAGAQLLITLALLGVALLPAVWLWREAYLVLDFVGLAVFAPFAYAIWGVTFCLLFVVVKYLVRGRAAQGSYPFFSIVVARWAFITQVSKVAHELFVFWVMGTDFIVWWYRLLGARIGQRVTINTVFVYDWDLLEIGDDSFIGGRSTLMGHIGQKGRVAFAPTTIGKRCTIGQDTTVFAGVVMEDGAVLGANSLALEGQHLRSGGVYLGVPARVIRRPVPSADPVAGHTDDDIAFLDRNESQFSVAPACATALRGLQRETLTQYSRDNAFIERVAAWLDVPAERVVVGNGSEGLLRTAFQRLLVPGDRVLVPDPSWPFYARLADDARADVCRYPLREDLGRFVYDVPSLVAAARATRPKVVIIASPNNPTGNVITPLDLIATMSSLGDACVILDEAYWGFANTDNSHARDLVARFPNLLILRTFSKFFGMAGLRLGYGIAGDALTRVVDGAAVYLGHNRVSETLAITALDNIAHYQELARALDTEKRNIAGALSGSTRVTCFSSSANFMLVRLDANAHAAFRDHARQLGVVVKCFTEPPLAHSVRITIGTPAQNARVLRALQVAVGTAVN